MAKYNMDGGGEAGTATAQPEAATTTPEQQPTGTAQAQPEKAPEAAPQGDAEVVKGIQEKLKKDPSYKANEEERAAFYRMKQGKPTAPKAEATPAPEAKPAPEIPQPLKAAMERLKVQKAEDLPTSIEKMQAEIQKLNGERGNLGPLQERLQTSTRTIETQQAIIRDILTGKPEALDWARKHAQHLGLDPEKIGQAKPAEQGQQQPAHGDQAFDPSAYLDPETAKVAHQANQAITGLKQLVEGLQTELRSLKENTEKYGKFYETELDKQNRVNAMEGAASLLQTLIDSEGVTGIYDRRHGPLRPHLDKFFEKGEVTDANRNLVELLKIANERKLDNLEDAYAIWERKNRGTRAVAAARAAQADPNVAPTVGLSDRQEGNSGRVQTGPTVQDVLDWKNGRKPIPAEFMKNGKFQTKLIPQEIWAQAEIRGR